MHPATNEGLPTPILKFESLMETSDTSVRPEKVFIGYNLGNKTFLTSIPMKEFFSMSKVANERQPDGTPATQRPLNEAHAVKLAKYILKGLLSAAINSRKIHNKPESPVLNNLLASMGTGAYLSLQPIVANLRSCNPGGANLDGSRMVTVDKETAAFKVYLRQQDLFYVIDGQHRRFAMEMVFDFLKEIRQKLQYPKKPRLFEAGDKGQLQPEILAAWDECDEVARSFCRVAIEVHLGLDPKQEQQLFHDLNNLGKSVDKSLALKFDSANPINHFIQNDLVSGILGWSDVIDKDNKDWLEDSGIWTFKDLASVNSILFLNKTNINTATPGNVDPKKDIARKLWQAIQAIPGFGEPGSKTKTVAAQPVVIKALAKLVFDLAFGRKKDANADSHLEFLLDSISTLDFSHENPCWRYYEFTDQERVTHGLETLKDHLPKEDDGSNRDIGGYDKNKKWMRFGAKHNDIYPIIGDMIRWQLRLPSRHQ